MDIGGYYRFRSQNLVPKSMNVKSVMLEEPENDLFDINVATDGSAHLTGELTSI
ncbi:MAG: hypothetical protein V1799_12995 [bacterium]